MRFGVRLPNSGPLASRQNMVDVADSSEKLGYDSVWVHDHITWGTEQHRTHLSAGSAEALDGAQRPNFYESVTTLSFVAGRCPSVKVGVAVIVLPLRNPLVIAKQLANLDVLSEGRLIVGVAPGAPNVSRPEFEALGVPYEERGRITDEYIRAIRALWSSDLPSFSGKYTSFKEVQLFPKPVQRYPPILIGGGERGISPRALRRVVELGDGWIPAYLTPDEMADGVGEVRKASAAAGRDPSKFLYSHELFTAIDKDGEKARRKAAASLATNFVSVAEGEKRSLVGSPREIADKLELYAEAGEDIVEIKWIYSTIPELLEMLRLFKDEVASSFH